MPSCVFFHATRPTIEMTFSKLKTLLIYLIIYLSLAFIFVLKPWEYTEWVAASWVAAIVAWATLASTRKTWSEGFSRICLSVAIGITPQFFFLILYNGFKDVELTPPAFIQHLIDRYEFLAVSLYELLRPIKEVGWQWWALSAVGLLGVSFVLQLPGFLSKVLQLRKVLATVIFIVWITLTLSLSSAIPVSNWEPDVQIRLKANLKEQVQYETNISLSQGLVSWLKSHPGTQTALPSYVRNIDNAIGEVKKDSSGQGRADKDIEAGLHATIRALVPQDIGFTLTKDLPAESSSQHELSSDVLELLRRDADMKQQNHALKLQADKVRETAKAFIAQVVDVPISSVPLLKEIVEEMINNAAELLSECILERLPIEQVIATSQNISYVGKAINGSIREIFDQPFRRDCELAPDAKRNATGRRGNSHETGDPAGYRGARSRRRSCATSRARTSTGRAIRRAARDAANWEINRKSAPSPRRALARFRRSSTLSFARRQHAASF
jgi:hypothetical protein